MNFKGIKDRIYTCKNCKSDFKFKGYSRNHIFCSINCNKEYRVKKAKEKHLERFELWIKGKSLDVQKTRPMVRQFVSELRGYKCECCGISEWNGKPLTLWLDHIDGDASNDSPNNVRLMCPNCDSQSDTFGAKNYGRGRKSRGMKQYG